MIVTTGGRSTRSSSASENSGSSGSSSAVLKISILRSYSSAIAFTDSSVRVWVRVAISPIIISFLITSALPSPSSSATSRTVAPDWTLVATSSTGSSDLGRGGFGRRFGRFLLRPGVFQRRFRLGHLRCGLRGVGGLGISLRRLLLGGFGRRLGRRRAAVPAGCRDRLQRVGLLDA